MGRYEPIDGEDRNRQAELGGVLECVTVRSREGKARRNNDDVQGVLVIEWNEIRPGTGLGCIHKSREEHVRGEANAAFQWEGDAICAGRKLVGAEVDCWIGLCGVRPNTRVGEVCGCCDRGVGFAGEPG